MKSQHRSILLAIVSRLDVTIKDPKAFDLIDLSVLKSVLVKHGFVESRKDIGGSSSYKLLSDPNMVIYFVDKSNPNFNLFMQDNLKVLAKFFKKTQIGVIIDLILEGIRNEDFTCDNRLRVIGEILQPNSSVSITNNAGD